MQYQWPITSWALGCHVGEFLRQQPSPYIEALLLLGTSLQHVELEEFQCNGLDSEFLMQLTLGRLKLYHPSPLLLKDLLVVLYQGLRFGICFPSTCYDFLRAFSIKLFEGQPTSSDRKPLLRPDDGFVMLSSSQPLHEDVLVRRAVCLAPTA